MKKIVVIVLLLFSANTYSETVTRVIDGDTVVLDKNIKVRLIGVDTPEFHKSRKLKKDAATTHCEMLAIQGLGEKSFKFTNGLVSNKHVKVVSTGKDKYRRTLAYLFLDDGTFVNLEIINSGYGRAYTRFPFEFKDKFVKAEQEAQKAKRGLWSDPKCL